MQTRLDPPEVPKGIPSKVFYLTTTDMPHYDQLLDPTKAEYFAKEKGEKGTIIWVTPDEALAKGAEIHGVSIEEELRIVSEEAISKYTEMMKQGEKFPLPVLDYKRKDQEGRHRLLAAKKAGVVRVPVLIVEKVTEPTVKPALPSITEEVTMLTEEEGKKIAEQLGLRYDGIQKGRKDIPTKYQFTDIAVTGTTFYGNTLEAVKAKLAEKRRLFGREIKEGGNPMPRTEAQRLSFHERIFGKGSPPPLERLGRGQTVNELLPMPPESGPPLPRALNIRWPWSKP